MTKPVQKNYVGISRDHSISMRHIAAPAMIDYNNTISDIAENSKTHSIDTIVSVVECGVGYEATVERAVTLSNVTVLKPMTSYDCTGNATPLYDSVGALIEQFEGLPDADDVNVSFLLMIITDGQNNLVRSWDVKKVAKKIAELQNTDRWTFVFRVPRGGKHKLLRHGIPEGNILEWDTTSKKGMEESSVVTQSAMRSFYEGRASGEKSTKRFFANLHDVSVKEIKTALVDISKEVEVIKVTAKHDGSQIRDFVQDVSKNGFKKGTAFYQLSKTEDVQENKVLAVRDKLRGAVYSGANARDVLGLSQTGTIKLAPENLGQWDVFVQSTSVNRKVVAGTYVLIWDKV